MGKINQASQPVAGNAVVELKNRLEETEETLRAIRQYMVDAFVVTHADDIQVVTLSDAQFPYRMMVESMNEGAVTLIPDGTIFYCNPRFGEMVKTDCEKLVGVRFHDLIRPEEQAAFGAFFSQAQGRGEFCLQPPDGKCVPVQLSMYPLAAGDSRGVSIIATDITERVQAEEKIRTLASQITMAEQEERQRISQILHDDLQQSLFAIKTQLTILMDSGEYAVIPALREELKQVQRWVSDAIGITRSLSVDLNPIVLQEGLADAIHWLSSQMKTQHGLDTQVQGQESFSNFNQQMRLLLFQTVRELLFNIVKHSGAAAATITLEQIDGKARITVTDTGKGFDVEAVMNDPKSAHGLLIVQDRLALMGCSLQMTSDPGQGTRVVIEAPLKESSA
ncbi:MAG TPA: PAS domain-containing sensor histidine kinase [Anaerolineales bacterium]|nr:PAS domain-containing sensor histidine kinase [Anaerolineales bacterium]